MQHAPEHGHTATMVDVCDFEAQACSDAIFLRLDTNVLGLSWAASRIAWASGQRVVDDPRSILTCMNKAHVQGLLEEAGVPTPETILLTPAGRARISPDLFDELGTPIVVKAPASAFSAAVERAHDERTLRGLVQRFSRQSDVVLLQRFTPSRYDWRVVVLCGRPLLAARYHMPPGAWRIHDTPEGAARKAWAKIERVPLEAVPSEVVDVAVQAAQAIGGSLYGVDLKQLDDGVVVIEVNDNPNLDHGGEVAPESHLWAQIIDRIATAGPRA